MEFTVEEIASLVDGKVLGGPSAQIRGVAEIGNAKEDEITFLGHSKYAYLLETSEAGAILVDRSFSLNDEWKHLVFIQVDNPSLAFDKIVRSIYPQPANSFTGISQEAYVHPEAQVSEDAVVMPLAYIGQGAKVGPGTTIFPGVYIGARAVIGESTILYPNVSVMDDCIVGDRVIVHGSTVIGSDGFGYEPVDGKHIKIAQVGNVVVEDEVEIGSNVSIDRARFKATVIAKGTKIDNLVHVAHNVKIGKSCLLLGQSGIAGSTSLEDHVIVAGQSGIAGHVHIGKGTVIASRSGVTKSFPDGKMISGFPAQDHNSFKKVTASLNSLPDALKQIKELRGALESLTHEVEDLKKK